MFDYVNPSYKEIKQLIAEGKKPMLFYHISKREVLEKDFRGIANLVTTLVKVGKGAKRSLLLTCNGYDDVTDELYAIKEVREFVQAMFAKYPYLFYYITALAEGDHWLLCSLADEVNSVFHGEQMTGNQLMEKYGLDLDSTPKVHVNITFKADSVNENKFIGMLKAIIKHGKLVKDARGGKRIAIEYAMRFNHVDRTLDMIGITKDEFKELMGGNN
jgi:hypothetical protein